jgi:hypothetical protein
LAGTSRYSKRVESEPPSSGDLDPEFVLARTRHRPATAWVPTLRCRTSPTTIFARRGRHARARHLRGCPGTHHVNPRRILPPEQQAICRGRAVREPGAGYRLAARWAPSGVSEAHLGRHELDGASGVVPGRSTPDPCLERALTQRRGPARSRWTEVDSHGGTSTGEYVAGERCGKYGGTTSLTGRLMARGRQGGCAFRSRRPISVPVCYWLWRSQS